MTRLFVRFLTLLILLTTVVLGCKAEAASADFLPESRVYLNQLQALTQADYDRDPNSSPDVLCNLLQKALQREDKALADLGITERDFTDLMANQYEMARTGYIHSLMNGGRDSAGQQNLRELIRMFGILTRRWRAGLGRCSDEHTLMRHSPYTELLSYILDPAQVRNVLYRKENVDTGAITVVFRLRGLRYTVYYSGQTDDPYLTMAFRPEGTHGRHQLYIVSDAMLDGTVDSASRGQDNDPAIYRREFCNSVCSDNDNTRGHEYREYWETKQRKAVREALIYFRPRWLLTSDFI